MASQAASGLSPSTITRRLAAIRLVHLGANHPSPHNTIQVMEVMRGIRRDWAKPPDRKAPAIDEKQALIEAQQAIGFPVGHASAQQVWHGLRSRPTWRVLCYSAEDPPRRRGLVLVDAVDGRVLQHLAEDNPEQWRPTPDGS